MPILMEDMSPVLCGDYYIELVRCLYKRNQKVTILFSLSPLFSVQYGQASIVMALLHSGADILIACPDDPISHQFTSATDRRR
jgi:hypothetical protein